MSPVLPRTLYRLTRGAYATSANEALSGVGGLYDDGRWHSRGRAIVYTGEDTSLCLLERIVHADEWIAERNADRVMLTLNIPRISSSHYLASELAAADPNWRDEGNATCRRLGDLWLAAGNFCALIVPSAANPFARNVLLNPVHSEFRQVIAANIPLKAHPIELDDRVVSLAKQRRTAGL